MHFQHQCHFLFQSQKWDRILQIYVVKLDELKKETIQIKFYENQTKTKQTNKTNCILESFL